MWLFRWIKRIIPIPGPPKDLGDWSLRANGDTYLDRSDESEILANRLKSSASVTGIAGQRGVGKSSLALRVLKNRSKEGAFTQLIHSPTGYDSREFLVTVFQRVCEEVVAHIDRDFGQALSLQERGKAEGRRLLSISLVLILGASILLMIPYALILQETKRQSALLSLFSSSQDLSRSLHDIDFQKYRLTDQLDALKEEFPERRNRLDALKEEFPERRNRLDALKGEFPERQDQLDALKEEHAEFQDQLDALKGEFPEFQDQLDALKGEFPEFQDQLDALKGEHAWRQNRLDALKEERTKLQEQPIIGTDVGLERFTLLLLMSIVIVYAIVIALFPPLRRIYHRMRHARQSPSKVGLHHRALELSEHLRFQTTLSTSTETGVSLLKATSRLSAEKNLVTRPLSLPGLTVEFAQFLEKIGEVFSGGVVICLDELDKIEDPRDLDKLLRGIKGVLGWPGTHFIFTVSEDALAGFATQRRLERGILERAFEDIIPLERIDLKVTDHVVGLMYAESDRRKTKGRIHSSIAILWLFGGAIPREIKRNVRMCLEAKVHPKKSPLKEVWKVLFLSRLNDLKSWALRFGRDSQVAYQFLHCLHESHARLGDNRDKVKYDLEWGRKFIAFWLENFEDLFSAAYQRENDDLSLAFGRAVIDILLGASVLVYVLEPKKFSDNLREQICEVFEITPSNLAFAGKKMKEYLTAIEVYSESDRPPQNGPVLDATHTVTLPSE